MDIDFVGGAYKTFSKLLNPTECVNFYPAEDKTGSVPGKALRSTPGLSEWLDTGNAAEVRNVCQMSRYSYWIVGDLVFQVDTDKNSTQCEGTLRSSSNATGFAWMATNGDQIMIVDGLAGYIIEDTTITEITDVDFPSRPTSVVFQDGYFIITIEESGRIYISATLDGTDWNGTDYGNAEARPDDSLALVSDRDELVVLGEVTKQSFQNTGATFPFHKVSGSTQSIGIDAPASLFQFANTFFWLTNKLQIVQAEGLGASIISPPAIDYQIAQMEKTDDCIGFGYTQEGASFLIFQFPTANQTWVFELSTGSWHRRTSYPNNGRWRANCYTYFNKTHLVGDHSNGKIYELDLDTFTDDGEAIKRKRITPIVRAAGKKIFVNYLEIFIESGVGLVSGQGSDPQMMLRFSRDGGRTWSNEIWRRAGKIGERELRTIWRRLGRAEEWTFELTVSDPVKWVITGADLDADLGD